MLVYTREDKIKTENMKHDLPSVCCQSELDALIHILMNGLQLC